MNVTGLKYETTLGPEGELVKLLRVQLEVIVPLTPEMARELGGALLGIDMTKRAVPKRL